MTITREQIARLRGIGCAYVINEQVEALLDAAEAHLSEQSRIDAAVAKERERCEQETRRYAGFYLPHSDGRNTFVMLADFIAAGRTPTPTTEEGA